MTMIMITIHSGFGPQLRSRCHCVRYRAFLAKTCPYTHINTHTHTHTHKRSSLSFYFYLLFFSLIVRFPYCLSIIYEQTYIKLCIKITFFSWFHHIMNFNGRCDAEKYCQTLTPCGQPVTSTLAPVTFSS